MTEIKSYSLARNRTVLTWPGVCRTCQGFPPLHKHLYHKVVTHVVSNMYVVWGSTDYFPNLYITAVLTLNHYFCSRHLPLTRFLSDFLGCTKKQGKSKPESLQEARLLLLQGLGIVVSAPPESIHSCGGNQTSCCDARTSKVGNRGCLQIFCCRRPTLCCHCQSPTSHF